MGDFLPILIEFMITRILRAVFGGCVLVSGLSLFGADASLVLPFVRTVSGAPANGGGAGGNAHTNTAPAAAARAYAMPLLDDRQKLAVGDRISFRVLEDNEDPKSLTVTDAGDLDVPYLGLCPVAGKTCRQVAVDLKNQLESRYYYHAHVVVGLESANRAGIGRRIYVTGQVRTPGPIDIPAGESMTVGQAVMRSGGFAEFADKRHVRVVRDGGSGKEKSATIVNVLEVWEKGRPADDLVLEPNDLIYVPTRLINF
jgi:polysaccharide biosynthesis/export protein